MMSSHLKQTKFNMDLCKSMVHVNIPVNKLSNVESRTFLQVRLTKSLQNQCVNNSI